MTALLRLAPAVEDGRGSRKELLLPEVEEIRMDGQLAADLGNFHAILKMTHYGLRLLV